ncbi:HNH endonuclease [Cryobacterium sp. GrIS_2_6]|uniref:HNH endonuclease n=1 Tax=Cryobacterium sp. GrIS_2_6 TaxID=3162785 RepID=UPI002DF7634F|nr:hypothetical protein [Cryobacterium psychrotolerans]MEC5149249.1 hypothetical protein [Cryobacterium psychrotolerans]MEC5149327.1 hypothetical protein [Cryobacterium psychrotolerans]
MNGTRNAPAAENWLPIPDFPGYEVSDLGRVRSFMRSAPIIMRQQFTSTGGYGHVGLHNGTSHTRKVHSLVLLAFVGPLPKGMVRRHLDGNVRNNALSNLRYGTQSENLLDQREHGTNARSNKTHCPQGHEYSPENTKMDGGSRICRTCHNQQGRDAYVPKVRRDPMAKTHCPKGHAYDGTVRSGGYLLCRICHNAWARADFAKKMAAR